MVVIACGDRLWTDAATLRRRLEQLPPGSTVIEGRARGADQLAGEAADALGLGHERYPADWKRYGRAAGPIRNGEMLRALLAHSDPDKMVVAFHARIEESRGTADMVKRARKAGVRVEIVTGGIE